VFFQFKGNASKLIFPALITMMFGTITYPLAVRFVKKVFRLKGFYAIHLTIAPFLALIHLNIFGVCHALFRIKHMESEYESLQIQNTSEEY